jgi:uncharacterized protein
MARARRGTSARGRRGGNGVLSWLLLATAAAIFGAGVFLGLGWRQPPPPTEPVSAVAAPPAATDRPSPGPPQGSAPGALVREAPAPAERGGGPIGHLALVIDDLGRSLEEVRRIEGLGIPISYSVLPNEARTAEVVAALARGGREVLLHLPMQPGNGQDPGPGALHQEMSAIELTSLTRQAMARVPAAVGVNNHMGSELTQDPQAMAIILRVLRDEQLFFLDSRTSAASVAFRTARQLGMAAAERHVFLDPDPDPAAIRGQFLRLLELAAERGAAIAIGHPYPTTLEVLEQEVPLAIAAGYVFVPVSFLLERDGAPMP